MWGRQLSRYSNWIPAGRSGDRIPVRTIFSAPVQTGPGAHPASCTMGTGFFVGVKSGRGVTLTPHPFQCRGKERVELYLYSPYGRYGLCRASVPVQGGTLPSIWRPFLYPQPEDAPCRGDRDRLIAVSILFFICRCNSFLIFKYMFCDLVCLFVCLCALGRGVLVAPCRH